MRGPSEPIVIGFSVRALAEATAAVVGPPVAVDHFCDHDCQTLSRTCILVSRWGPGSRLGSMNTAAGVRQTLHAPSTDNLENLLAELKRATVHIPDACVLLGGGTENWPELLSELSTRFKLLGPTTRQLSTLRSLDFWREIADCASLGFPETRHHKPIPPEAATGWLQKPQFGAGGIGVRRIRVSSARVSSTCAPAGATASGPYWQREIIGRVLGAQCMLLSDCSRLMGVTQSLSSADWPGPTEFAFRGAFGPIELADNQVQSILAMCDRVRTATGLRGWMNFDLIEDGEGQLWLLELNPRWTAGMELLHLAGINPVGQHFQAWGMPAGFEPTPTRTGLFAKAVLYADQDTRLAQPVLDALHSLPGSNYADLPSQTQLDNVVASGHPLLTLRTQIDLMDPITRHALESGFDPLKTSALAQLGHLRATVQPSLQRA